MVVNPGDLGGWLEKESNLSHDGKAWVWGNAEVWGNAKVWGNAVVCDNAKVWGNAKVCNDAFIFRAEHLLKNGRFERADLEGPGKRTCRARATCGNVGAEDAISGGSRF